MNRTLIESSDIKSVGYDEFTHKLEIEFHRSGIYTYYDVTPTLFNSFMNAESKGNFLARVIKPFFKVAKVESSRP